MGEIASYGSAVGFHGLRLQTQSLEDAYIGVVHRLVTLRHAFTVAIKRVGIFHDELARAHHPETWSDLVPELGLDLVQVHG